MLKQATLGATLGVLGFFFLAGIGAACGASTLAECELAAVRALPLDNPDAIDVRDARQLAARLVSCAKGDAGAR